MVKAPLLRPIYRRCRAPRICRTHSETRWMSLAQTPIDSIIQKLAGLSVPKLVNFYSAFKLMTLSLTTNLLLMSESNSRFSVGLPSFSTYAAYHLASNSASSCFIALTPRNDFWNLATRFVSSIKRCLISDSLISNLPINR